VYERRSIPSSRFFTAQSTYAKQSEDPTRHEVAFATNTPHFGSASTSSAPLFGASPFGAPSIGAAAPAAQPAPAFSFGSNGTNGHTDKGQSYTFSEPESLGFVVPAVVSAMPTRPPPKYTFGEEESSAGKEQGSGTSFAWGAKSEASAPGKASTAGIFGAAPGEDAEKPASKPTFAFGGSGGASTASIFGAAPVPAKDEGKSAASFSFGATSSGTSLALGQAAPAAASSTFSFAAKPAASSVRALACGYGGPFLCLSSC
jgi:hypothetical protein